MFRILCNYNGHHSILKLREVINIEQRFHFTRTDEENISEKIKFLDKNKAATRNGIPSKYLAEYYDTSPFIRKICNDSTTNLNSLKKI